MRVLVACEVSGKVREAFRARGHDAWSNDLVPADDGSPFHIVGDCREVIRRGWDLIIMHPPCTALCVSGNRTYAEGKVKWFMRREAIRWTLDLFALAKQYAKRVAMENPVGVIPLRATQYIQPWQFGHGETKSTGLWLHNLPPLIPTDIVPGRLNRIWLMAPSDDRSKLRSETFDGVAKAMAEQWAKPFILPRTKPITWADLKAGEVMPMMFD